MKQRWKGKIWSILLSAAMVLGCIGVMPMTAKADNGYSVTFNLSFDGTVPEVSEIGSCEFLISFAPDTNAEPGRTLNINMKGTKPGAAYGDNDFYGNGSQSYVVDGLIDSDIVTIYVVTSDTYDGNNYDVTVNGAAERPMPLTGQSDHTISKTVGQLTQNGTQTTVNLALRFLGGNGGGGGGEGGGGQPGPNLPYAQATVNYTATGSCNTERDNDPSDATIRMGVGHGNQAVMDFEIYSNTSDVARNLQFEQVGQRFADQVNVNAPYDDGGTPNDSTDDTVTFYFGSTVTSKYTQIRVTSKADANDAGTTVTLGANQMIDLKNQIDVVKAYTELLIWNELTIAKGAIYDVEVTVAPAVRDEETLANSEIQIGNFGWFFDAQHEGTDDYVGGGTLDFISFDWVDLDNPTRAKSYTKADLEKPRTALSFIEEETGMSGRKSGNAVLPSGGDLTLKLNPEPGKQLVEFTCNGFPFETGDNISEYTFEIGQGNFHLGAKFEEVDDEVATEAEGITGGSVDIGNLALNAGTALLSVTDASSAAQSVKGASEDETAFVAAITNPAVVLTEYAESQGMQVADVLSISLDNVIYRGSMDLNDAWRIPLGADDPLDNPVHVDLDLDEDIASLIGSNDVTILSIGPDGNVMELEGGFDPEHSVLSFDTDYFSTIAIATVGADDHLQEQIDLLNNLYNTLFGRGGDDAGMQYWLDGLQSHLFDGANLIYGFFNSDEFLAKELTNEEFVDFLYQGILGRSADEKGKADWLAQLEGGATRNEIIGGFINTPEFQAYCGAAGILPGKTFPDGKPYRSEYRYIIEHFYATSLGRTPDSEGIEYWVEKMNVGGYTLEDVLFGFLHSVEYQAFEYTDDQYVTSLYSVCIGREPDTEGKAYWLEQLAGGASRDDVARGFLYSQEFQNMLDSLGL
ncbi:MAG: DUF4214 domain-containing protein [Lachnospiraceae bacterium]|nr:DUF4214 domain-containing protein [Lachnospiraceae bacterium]